MKVIERSPFRGENKPVNVIDRLRGIWRFGISWDKDMRAQATLITNLSRNLDNKHFLVCNVTLPEISLPIPLVLVGPSGVRSIYTSAAKGIYRAKEEAWLVLENRSDRYTSARPNLIRRTLLMARAVQRFLGRQGHPLQEVEPVLFFSQAGILVEAVQPAVRLVQSDSIERFAANLVQNPILLNSEQIERIVHSLTTSVLAKTKASLPKKSPSPKGHPIKADKTGLRAWQWLVLGLILLTILLVGVGFAVLIFFTP